MTETRNAVVESASIRIERGFALTIWIRLNYGGAVQGFGGYCLSHTAKGPSAHLAAWVLGLMKVFGVDDWSKISGRPCRVVCDHGRVYRIGHLLKDDWFDPEESNVTVVPCGPDCKVVDSSPDTSVEAPESVSVRRGG